VSSRRIAGALVLAAGAVAGGGASASAAVLALPGFAIESDNVNGRPSPAGVDVLAARLAPGHDTVVFDLGTNDGPAGVGVTAASLVAARELAAGRCLVVATLNHPPVAGIPVDAQNSTIRRFAASTPNVALVDWHAAAQADGLLRPDGVHATSPGYALRGRLFAEAISGGCLSTGGGAGGSAPRPDGRSASATDRPADRRPPGGGAAGPDFAARALATLADRLAADGGPLDMLAKAGDAVGSLAATAHASLTPRGPEPVLGGTSRSATIRP
jgi:hypothetical protein